MKTLFVASRYKGSVFLKNINLKKLPKKIGLLATIQHTNSLSRIKTFLEKNNKIITIPDSKKLEPGQVLGCDVRAATRIQGKVDAFLHIGSGKFHPLLISLETNKPIFLFNPLNQQFSRLEEKEIKKARAKKKAQKVRFMSSDKFGILVSTKPGQNNLKEAIKLKSKLEKQGKKAHLFIFDNLDLNQLENFPSVECWVNTACPGLSLENNLVWFEDI